MADTQKAKREQTMAQKKQHLTLVQQRQNTSKSPANGEPWTKYKLKNVLENGKWHVVPRNQRQHGKIQEAQNFRRAQGAYIKARLHFFDVARQAQGNLRWWFST